MEGPYRRAFAGETVTVEVPFADRIYTLSVAPLDRVDGAVRTIVAVAQDITERVRAERALARREAQLAEAQRLAHVGSWERDIATGRLTWSDELYRIYGLEPQEIPASFEAFMEHVHPDDAARVRAINEAAVRSGESFEYQARILRPDGEVRHYHSRGAVLRDASGRPSRLVGVVQDATERVRAEEARALRRERQARLDGMLFAVRELAVPRDQEPRRRARGRRHGRTRQDARRPRRAPAPGLPPVAGPPLPSAPRVAVSLPGRIASDGRSVPRPDRSLSLTHRALRICTAA